VFEKKLKEAPYSSFPQLNFQTAKTKIDCELFPLIRALWMLKPMSRIRVKILQS